MYRVSLWRVVGLLGQVSFAEHPRLMCLLVDVGLPATSSPTPCEPQDYSFDVLRDASPVISACAEVLVVYHACLNVHRNNHRISSAPSSRINIDPIVFVKI